MGTSSLTQNPHWLYSDSVATRVHFSVWQCWKYKTLQHARDGLYSWWGWSLGVVGCTIFVEPRFLKERVLRILKNPTHNYLHIYNIYIHIYIHNTYIKNPNGENPPLEVLLVSLKDLGVWTKQQNVHLIHNRIWTLQVINLSLYQWLSFIYHHHPIFLLHESKFSPCVCNISYKDAGVSAIVFHPSRSLLLPSHFPKPETLCLEYIKAVFSIVIHTRITHRR